MKEERRGFGYEGERRGFCYERRDKDLVLKGDEDLVMKGETRNGRQEKKDKRLWTKFSRDK